MQSKLWVNYYPKFRKGAFMSFKSFSSSHATIRSKVSTETGDKMQTQTAVKETEERSEKKEEKNSEA